MSFYESDYREIITKAVCGSGQNRERSTNEVTPAHKPTSILGCWVINHQYGARKKTTNTVEVQGTYDINIWYSYHDNTKTEVVTETMEYCDDILLENQDMHCMHDEDEVIAKVLEQPNCMQCKIVNNGTEIAVEIERAFMVKVIGETKVNVWVNQASNEHQPAQDRNAVNQEREAFKGNRK